MLRAGNFPFYSESENKLSRKRIAWLYDHITVLDPMIRATLCDQTGQIPKYKIAEMCDVFWDRVITPLCNTYKLDRHGLDVEGSAHPEGDGGKDGYGDGKGPGSDSTGLDTLHAMERDMNGITLNHSNTSTEPGRSDTKDGSKDGKDRRVSFYPTGSNTTTSNGNINDDTSVASIGSTSTNTTVGNGSISSLSASIDPRQRRTSAAALQYLDSVKPVDEYVIGINEKIYRELVIVALFLYMEVYEGCGYGTTHSSHNNTSSSGYSGEDGMELEYIGKKVVEIEMPFTTPTSTSSADSTGTGDKKGKRQAFQMFERKR